MRVTVAVGVACLSLVSVTFADAALAAIRQKTNIDAQELAPALKRLAKDRDVQFVYRSDLVKDLRTGGAAGDLTLEEALDELLSGTGLTYKYLENNAVTLVQVNQDKKLPGSRFRLAQSYAAESDSSSATTSGYAPQLEEVVVTAEKRSERLLDVPIPVSVIRSEQLTESNQTRLQDYFTQVPGLTMTDMVGGTPALAIRGITTGGFGNPTVGTTIDDAPVGFSTGTGGGYQAIDLDPSDLQRIEVLRGPQGTLYGASSMGGVLKYVTLDPTTAGVSGRVEEGVEGVENGRGLGETVRGSVNVPLGSDLAASVSGFARHDEGYIDDPVRNLDGVNDGHAYGGRFALLWKPLQDFSVKLNVIHQDGVKSAPDDVAGPDLKALQAGATFIPGSSGYKQRTTFVDSVVDWKPGKIDLTSVTAYSKSRDQLYLDLYTLSGVAQAFYGVSGVPYLYDTEGHKFSQELRASIPIGSRVTWLVGGFFTREVSTTLEDIQAGDFITGAPVGTLLTSRYPTTYQEYAEFTNVTIDVTERADIQLGARESEIRQHYSDTQTGPLGSPATPDTPTSASAFTFLVTPEYKLSADTLAYVRVASGYRAGGPNFNAQQFGLPTTFKPDKTRNYDIGLKGRAFGQLFTYDASLYYIDWDDIQIREITDGFASVANAGGAKSEGAELSITLNPLRGLTVSAWSAYDHAVLTSALPPASTAVAYAGERLPYSSRWSGNVSAEQLFPINASLNGFIGAAANFIGDRLSDFTPTNDRTVLPSYNKVDMHGGLEFDRWKVNVFANNVTNQRGIVAQAYASPAFHIIKPRTIGLDISTRF